MIKFDKRFLYVVLGIVVLKHIMERLTTTNSILALLLTLPAILIATTFHEFAHAFAADKLGDDTPRLQGRLTLNPLKHMDPVGTILLIVAGFGWGKPVQINPIKFKRDISMTKAEAIVAVAGPLMNFFLAIISTIVLALLIKYDVVFMSSNGPLLLFFVEDLILINVGLGVFNLIPLPPLDGSKILYNFLSYDTKQWFSRNESLLYIAFMVIWLTGIASIIITPCISAVARFLCFIVGGIFNIDLATLIGL